MKTGFDLLLANKGNSGDLILKNNDLVLTSSLSQQAYLCLFGGNVEASTLGNEIESQTRLDWWGNSLIEQSGSKYFNSETEKTLNNVVKNSSGRNKIIESVKKDLSVLTNVCTFTVDVELTSRDVKININLIKKGDTEEKKIQVVWDSLSKESIINYVI